MTKQQIYEIIGDSVESKNSRILYALSVAAMVSNIFCIVGILFVSFIVYIAGEEIELLHDLPEFNSIVFK